RSATESTGSIPRPQSWAELSAEHQRFHTEKRTSPHPSHAPAHRAKAPHPAARIRPTPTQRKPSLSVEPSLVDVSFGQPEAFGHLPGRVLGPHTGIDQGADFAEVV